MEKILSNSKCYLLRSPEVLLKKGLAGYGWGIVDFTQFTDANTLISNMLGKVETLGRQENQIRRFYNISSGDLLVVPVYKAIVIGIATEQRSYQKGLPYGENQISVNYLTNKDGQVIRIPRTELSHGLSSRLRIRMTVVSLAEFKEELLRTYEDINKNGLSYFKNQLDYLQNQQIEQFKPALLQNIKSGKTNLESGGYGLEQLVCCLLELEGYQAKITSKRQYNGIADSDIEATSINRFNSTKLLVQVKHHSGETGLHGIKQLSAINTDEDDIVTRVLVTSGSISEKNAEVAESENIIVYDGEKLVDWILELWDVIPTHTKQKLGVADLPTILL